MTTYLTIPYTYLIGWSNLNIWYYGVRYAQGCNPTELWQTYFTSSGYVSAFVNQHGNPDIIKIRKIFNEVSKARLWEHCVLKRMNVVQRNDFLNRTDNKSITPQYGSNNPATRLEVQDKIRAGVLKWYETNNNPQLGTTWTNEEKQKWSDTRKGENNPFYGHTHTKENKQFYSERQQGESNSFYGKTHSNKLKDKWSKERSGIAKTTVCCVYCRAEVGINTFPRWHGDNCKKH